MDAVFLKRLLFTLIAFAFIGANVLPLCDATTHQNAVAMSAPMGPCPDCPTGPPANELAKMSCGALACAGMLGLPMRDMIAMPDPAKDVHTPSVVNGMAGISIKPDPFPPRPSMLA